MGIATSAHTMPPRTIFHHFNRSHARRTGNVNVSAMGNDNVSTPCVLQSAPMRLWGQCIVARSKCQTCEPSERPACTAAGLFLAGAVFCAIDRSGFHGRDGGPETGSRYAGPLPRMVRSTARTKGGSFLGIAATTVPCHCTCSVAAHHSERVFPQLNTAASRHRQGRASDPRRHPAPGIRVLRQPIAISLEIP